jgi:hypothetical protein
MPRLLTIENKAGEPLQSGALTIIPFAQTIRLQFPGVIGGLRWTRPVSVLARTPEGEEKVYPISDVTRQVQWWLLGASLGAAICMWLVIRLRKD